MTKTTQVPIDLAKRADDLAWQIFVSASHFGRPFKECLGEIYMIGIRAGAEAAANAE